MRDLRYSKPLRSSLVALVVATLTACAVGPNYTHPDLPVPEGFAAGSTAANATVAAPLPDADAEFWRRFDDPLLDELVDTALAANHDLRIALSRFDQANALLREARFDQLPTVTANARTTCPSSRRTSGSTRERRPTAWSAEVVSIPLAAATRGDRGLASGPATDRPMRVTD